MSNLSPQNYHRIQAEINEVIGDVECFSSEERSRVRLMRVKKGMVHILCEVLPQITDPQKQELYYWLEAINRISGTEVVDAKLEGKA